MHNEKSLFGHTTFSNSNFGRNYSYMHSSRGGQTFRSKGRIGKNSEVEGRTDWKRKKRKKSSQRLQISYFSLIK